MKKLFITLGLTVIFLSSCINKKTETYYGDLQPISLGAMASMDYVPFLIAQKEGIYDSLGLNVNFIRFFSANDRDAAFQSGNIDGTVIDLTGAAIQQANGIGLKIVTKNDGYFYFISSKNSGVKNLSDLKGKNIAVSRNTAIEFSTDKALASVGIQPSEVNKPEINKIPLRLEMLQNDQIDAGIFPDPFATIAIHNGNHVLITTKELGLSITGTIFSEKTIIEKPEEIKVLLKGYNLAVDYIKSHPLEDWKDILINEIGLPSSLIEYIKLPDYQHAGLPSKKDIISTIEWLKNKELIPSDYNEEELIDKSFTKKLR